MVNNDAKMDKATLRDLFAAHALTGILAGDRADLDISQNHLLAWNAYCLADCMLAARREELTR